MLRAGVFLAGLALVVAGLYLVALWLALVVAGVGVMALAVLLEATHLRADRRVRP